MNGGVAQLIQCLPSVQKTEFDPQDCLHWVWWSTISSTGKVEAERSEVQAHPQVSVMFDHSLPGLLETIVCLDNC